MSDLHALHHVTALVADAQRTHDFYAGVLGMRLVKRTVNFDDPHTYHLYYGDETGAPGTLLTFFPYPRIRAGRPGLGQAAVTALAVPRASIAWWLERLVTHGGYHEHPVTRFGHSVVTLKDPDGMLLELVGSDYAAALPGWAGGPVPAEHAIRGVHGVTIWEGADHGTAELLTTVLGFAANGVQDSWHRFTAGAGGLGATVEVRRLAGFLAGVNGGGTVHHIAFRARDDAQQRALATELVAHGVAPTDVIDRQYFASIYFREPGGVLFEVATDGPGMAIDESVAELGRTLKLPPRYEASRADIDAHLPPLRPFAEVV